MSFCLRGTCALVSSDGGVPVGLRGSGRRASALVGSSGEPFPPPWCGRGSGRVRLCPCAPCAVFPAGGGVLGPGAASSALAEVTCVQEALGGGGLSASWGAFARPRPPPGWGGGSGWLSFCRRETCALVASAGGVPGAPWGSGRGASALAGSSGGLLPSPWCGRGSGRVVACRRALPELGIIAWGRRRLRLLCCSLCGGEGGERAGGLGINSPCHVKDLCV